MPAAMPSTRLCRCPSQSREAGGGIDAVRQCYLDRCAAPGVDLVAEQKIVFDAMARDRRQAGDAGATPLGESYPHIGQLVDDLPGDSRMPRPTEAL